MRRIFKLCLPIALLAHAAAAMAVAVQVAIDTHALPAAGFVVAFDLVDGGLPANTVVLTQLATDGSFATATFTGDAAASANAMTLGDAQFFNEILLPLASATELSFDIDMSLAAPAPGSLPDAFSLFLLDRSTLLPIVTTTDPTGAQSLLTIQSGDSPQGPLTTFADSGVGSAAAWTVTPSISAVPEPASAALMLAGLAGLLLWRRPRRSLLTSIGLAALVLPGLAQAAIHVMPGGGTSSPHDGAKWESAYSATELQDAINHNAGAEFWLSKGAYGQLQNVTDGTQLYGGFVGGLLGEMTRDARDAVANLTFFDGILISPYDDGAGNVIVQGPATTVDGFHIGGFGFILEQASPTLANNVISAVPVGIDLRMGAGPTINDSQITGTSYGVFVSGPVQAIKVGPTRIEARPTINRSTISGQARTGVIGDIGIGLGENSAGGLPTLVVNSGTFSGSTARAMELLGNAQFSDCIIENNGNGALSAVYVGAGDPGRVITFDRCKIRDNRGTGLLASPSTDTIVTIRRSEITGNDSSKPPPGPGTDGVPHAGGVHVNSDGVQIVETKIVGNRTTSVGGGVYFETLIRDVTRNTIVNSLIASNSAAVHGGGIASGSASFGVLNSTIVGNSAPIGAGVWLDPYVLPSFKPTVSIVNTAIVGNTAPLGSAIALETFATPPTSIFRNDVTLAGDTYASSYTITARPSPLGAGSFAVADPDFIAAASGDYRLGSGSPLIDRGDSAPINAYIAAGGAATDLAGQPRIAGAAVDVGAFEAAAAGVTDITSQVSLRLGGLVFDRATRRYAQVATITNSSGGQLSGPISLVFDSLPAGVTVAGMTNVTVNQLPAGSPYIDVLAADFAPGMLLTMNLHFDDPFNSAIRYVARVLGGAGPR